MSLLYDTSFNHPATQRVAMRVTVGQAILDTQQRSSSSHVISEDSDLYLPFK